MSRDYSGSMSMHASADSVPVSVPAKELESVDRLGRDYPARSWSFASPDTKSPSHRTVRILG